ncbi:putative hydrolase of the HAD superfamily [Saccharopolyspora spinosa]|uniref:Hydrolase of the HAD superfamily n=1 Tax=Saccharopolyspora spinosa TaxID=60894 RepID=A0A2N3Y756_SACSN|nr:putative hydrolase of the HAD superfamily [Saccharopolyspora spinosa]
MDAVAFDLFGTLVTAPTPQERTRAASGLAAVIGCGTATVDQYFRNTWHARHNGTLPTLRDLATHLVHAADRPGEVIGPVADRLRALGQARLVPAPSVVYALQSLRSKGLRIGILSDASAEIAAAWPKSPLAALVDTAVFSCTAGALKPDPRLYRRILEELGVPAHRTLYVGDGGGDELHGALAAGMAAVAVRRRGPADAVAFGDTDWHGPVLDAVESVPPYLTEQK